jgi:hypothetical protein
MKNTKNRSQKNKGNAGQEQNKIRPRSPVRLNIPSKLNSPSYITQPNLILSNMIIFINIKTKPQSKSPAERKSESRACTIAKQQEISTSQSKPVTASRYGQQTPIDSMSLAIVLAATQIM